ncbi:copper chaperone PCu(A)C [Pseudonocardia adelaidensis]|uniref:Copper(I)-binding protein n=1 Tax=Pseudonocardia adelaidensis TaxID=648754 RepID=A0ABP9NCH2_9PSEU
MLLAAVVVLVGCGSPDRPEFVKTRDSNYGQIGDVRLLHVHVASPPREGWQPGDTVPLHMTIANDGASVVTLTGIRSPRATRVVHEAAGSTTDVISIQVEPGQTASLQENDPEQLALVGLTERLRGGLTIPVTFTLDTGESVTLSVPAQTSNEPR